MAGTARRAW